MIDVAAGAEHSQSGMHPPEARQSRTVQDPALVLPGKTPLRPEPEYGRESASFDRRGIFTFITALTVTFIIVPLYLLTKRHCW
jgi:hypothetical protein